jgi:hypothetical protein
MKKKEGLLSGFKTIFKENNDLYLKNLSQKYYLLKLLNGNSGESIDFNPQHITKAYFPDFKDLKWQTLYKENKNTGVEKIVIAGINPYNSKTFVVEKVTIFPIKEIKN